MFFNTLVKTVVAKLTFLIYVKMKTKMFSFEATAHILTVPHIRCWVNAILNPVHIFRDCFSLPTPNSERQVIIHTPAKCLVKSPGKTELTSMEPNLKTLDRISLQTSGSCQVTFTAFSSLAAALALSGWVLASLLLPPGCEQKLSGISS